MALRALARVNLAAIERNVVALRGRLDGGAELCAVVKADASGHGAVPVARAALAGRATMLAVATAGEAAELRAARLTAPILIMGAVSSEELPVALGAGAEVVAWNERFVQELAAAAPAGRGSGPVGVHVKLDSGMGRLGTRDSGEAFAVAESIHRAAPRLRLAGAMTHLATADGDLAFAAAQLEVFAPFAAELQRRYGRLRIHAANSAGTLRVPGSHFDMVRCGIALYGCDPMNEDPDSTGLEQAMELSTYVAAVKRAETGDSVGYSRRFVARQPTWIATMPIGYADGVRRGLTNNCDVLIDGRRYPLVGTVSMDNITADLGPIGPDVRAGTRAILIGRSGEERQTVEDIARRLETINHEVLCGISARVPRQYHRDGVGSG
ncbi:MAG TPA: alanine racemase [Solirubrobacteraceae bacterium]|jgi:alanine racemase|nr:alanine racemase [Solirubrobacteraceae bacterium]